MTWRRFNGSLVLVMAALWIVATVTGEIGSTNFIGHVSMLALVLASLASWRADVPTKDTEQ